MSYDTSGLARFCSQVSVVGLSSDVEFLISSSAVIVEDDPLLELALNEALERAGITVTASFAYGEKAVEKLADLDPDVVVMDVRLAGRLDGIEAARLIRRTWHGPIVFHTADNDPAKLEAMAAVGRSSLVAKPAAPDYVAEVVAQLVGPPTRDGRSWRRSSAPGQSGS